MSPAAVPVPLKAVALPVEHGGWGLLVEPIVLGLVIAPSAAGLSLGGAALAAFLVRHPLRLVLLDRRKGARHPRTALAERFVVFYGALALALAALALPLARAPFWPALALGIVPAVVALGFDLRGRSREALAEAAGGVALGASASAIALAGGAAAGIAFGAWALVALRSVTAILYVRARLRLDRGLAAAIPSTLASHAAAVAGTVLLATGGWGPWMGVAALVVLLLRAACGLSSRRSRLRPQALGYREMGWGFGTLVLIAVGYRLGL
jgi:hypothetical protein